MSSSNSLWKLIIMNWSAGNKKYLQFEDPFLWSKSSKHATDCYLSLTKSLRYTNKNEKNILMLHWSQNLYCILMKFFTIIVQLFKKSKHRWHRNWYGLNQHRARTGMTLMNVNWNKHPSFHSVNYITLWQTCNFLFSSNCLFHVYSNGIC